MKRVYADIEYWMITKEYKCSNCQRKLHGDSSLLIDSLPKFIQDHIPFFKVGEKRVDKHFAHQLHYKIAHRESFKAVSESYFESHGDWYWLKHHEVDLETNLVSSFYDIRHTEWKAYKQCP